MATRKKDTYYWIIKGKHANGKNFKTLTQAKTWIRTKIRKDKTILGRNHLWFVKSPIKDESIGYYGISGKWQKGN